MLSLCVPEIYAVIVEGYFNSDKEYFLCTEVGASALIHSWDIGHYYIGQARPFFRHYARYFGPRTNVFRTRRTHAEHSLLACEILYTLFLTGTVVLLYGKLSLSALWASLCSCSSALGSDIQPTTL